MTVHDMNAPVEPAKEPGRIGTTARGVGRLLGRICGLAVIGAAGVAGWLAVDQYVFPELASSVSAPDTPWPADLARPNSTWESFALSYSADGVETEQIAFDAASKLTHLAYIDPAGAVSSEVEIAGMSAFERIAGAAEWTPVGPDSVGDHVNRGVLYTQPSHVSTIVPAAALPFTQVSDSATDPDAATDRDTRRLDVAIDAAAFFAADPVAFYRWPATADLDVDDLEELRWTVDVRPDGHVVRWEGRTPSVETWSEFPGDFEFESPLASPAPSDDDPVTAVPVEPSRTDIRRRVTRDLGAPRSADAFRGRAVPSPPMSGPIGMFDSGFGGLTVARAMIDLLPWEDLVYIGDTGRYPYGSKPLDDVRRFSHELAHSLVDDHGAKAIVVACNTATAAGLDELRSSVDVPVIDVIGPGAKALVSTTTTGRVGVIGTVGTVRSGAYVRSIAGTGVPVSLTSAACPGFVEFVERGQTAGDEVTVLAERLLAPIVDADIDALLLGCTHYPFLARVISDVMGPTVTLVSSADETAFAVRSRLSDAGLLRDGANPGRHRFASSGDIDVFRDLGSRLLGPELDHTEHWPNP